ncbi:hypothetical protein PR002_g2485 [Phytophthora rubi]|uniref:Aquaporin n=1 Tax=Phytophthora rubi TaxID=129364 RepID=A0A6A3NR32_9STRA|nr:hypothetical protein PR002_g2485 [Phytophthora rubi]
MPPRDSDANDKAENGYVGLQEADVEITSMPVKNYQVKSPLLRECMAEFIGTMVLIMFGDGVVAQVVLSHQRWIQASTLARVQHEEDTFDSAGDSL